MNIQHLRFKFHVSTASHFHNTLSFAWIPTYVWCIILFALKIHAPAIFSRLSTPLAPFSPCDSTIFRYDYLEGYATWVSHIIDNQSEYKTKYRFKETINEYVKRTHVESCDGCDKCLPWKLLHNENCDGCTYCDLWSQSVLKSTSPKRRSEKWTDRELQSKHAINPLVACYMIPIRLLMIDHC